MPRTKEEVRKLDEANTRKSRLYKSIMFPSKSKNKKKKKKHKNAIKSLMDKRKED